MLVNMNTDWKLAYCKDDPVRPHLPLAWRVADGREVYALYEDQFAVEAPVMNEGPEAMICLSYTNGVATTEADLENTSDPDTVMFYTVWSYVPGAGRNIINTIFKHIQDTRPEIKRYVTLSPPTEMAHKFHTRNGAALLQRNESTVNYEYTTST